MHLTNLGIKMDTWIDSSPLERIEFDSESSQTKTSKNYYLKASCLDLGMKNQVKTKEASRLDVVNKFTRRNSINSYKLCNCSHPHK